MVHRLLTAEELAEILRVGKDRVYFLARKGLVPTIRVGAHIRFDASTIDAWLAAGGQGLKGDK